MNDENRDLNLIAETFVALHDEGFSTFDPKVISVVEKKFGFNESQLDNQINDILMKRLKPKVEYALFGKYVKVTYKGKILYFSGKTKCHYRESSYIESMDAFYAADVIIDVENGHILKNRDYSIVKVFENFFDKEYGFVDETY